MKKMVNFDNMVQLQGNVSNIVEFSENKAAAITLAVDNGNDKKGNERPASFIKFKSFSPRCYSLIKKGMKIRVYGHISPTRFEKDGEMVYTQNIVADCVEFLETKAVVEAREARHNQMATEA